MQDGGSTPPRSCQRGRNRRNRSVSEAGPKRTANTDASEDLSSDTEQRSGSEGTGGREQLERRQIGERVHKEAMPLARDLEVLNVKHQATSSPPKQQRRSVLPEKPFGDNAG
jgi:hypothetical protein